MLIHSQDWDPPLDLGPASQSCKDPTLQSFLILHSHTWKAYSVSQLTCCKSLPGTCKVSWASPSLMRQVWFDIESAGPGCQDCRPLLLGKWALASPDAHANLLPLSYRAFGKLSAQYQYPSQLQANGSVPRVSVHCCLCFCLQKWSTVPLRGKMSSQALLCLALPPVVLFGYFWFPLFGPSDKAFELYPLVITHLPPSPHRNTYEAGLSGVLGMKPSGDALACQVWTHHHNQKQIQKSKVLVFRDSII